MRHAFLILAHERPAQLRRLVEVLQHPCAKVFVHLDVKTAHCFPALDAHVQSRHDISWAGPSMVDATLDLIRAAHDAGPFDSYTLLSGVDWPVQPLEHLMVTLDGLEASLLDFWRDEDSSWHARYRRYFFYERPGGRLLNAFNRRLTRFLPDRKPPIDVYFGSQWWTLRHDAASRLLAFTQERPDVMRWLRTIHIPDECFVQTVLCNASPRCPLERGTRRYLDWSEGRAHPRALDVSDLDRAHEGGYLFARKVMSLNVAEAWEGCLSHHQRVRTSDGHTL